MNYFKVELFKDNNANEDQIIDGCLGNNFGNGLVSDYESLEALKKAKMFGGYIKLSRVVKFIYVMMNSREGEFSTTVKTVHEVSLDEDINEYADILAKEYYNDENVEDDGKEWLHNSGCIATSILKVEVISNEDYEVLRKYI